MKGNIEDEWELCVYCYERKEIVFETIYDEDERFKITEMVCLDCIGATGIVVHEWTTSPEEEE